MSKYRGPRLRVTRRLGELPSFVRKTSKRRFRPGQHGTSRRKPTQFALRLTEKQKLRFCYGVSEKKLVRYIKAARGAIGSTGQLLMRQLEIRLDNVVYRLGWALTLPAARQMVTHGHILVNQQQVNIPRFICLPNQIIRVRNVESVRQLVKNNLQECIHSIPSHLSSNSEILTASIHKHPDCSEISVNLNELLVIEYYSNRLLTNFKLYFLHVCRQDFFHLL
jgi:small subunit ribosomal protein S4